MVQDFTTDEGIPLTEDVVKRPPREFSATLGEWAADNIEQINIGIAIIGINQLVYKVPDKFTLFLTSAHIAQVCTGGAGRRFAILAANENTFLSTQLTAAQDNAHNSISFLMPIKVTSGNEVIASASAGAMAIAGIVGYLLPKKISIR